MKRLRLQTLSPLHIGNGETLKPLSYVKDKSFIYVLNTEAFFREIAKIQKRNAYLNWLEPIINGILETKNKIANAKDNFELKRALNITRRDFENQLSVDGFIKNLINKNPVEFAKSCTQYKIPFSSPPQTEGFKMAVKGGNGRAYVPGTEIKGSIRTSLLYYLLQEDCNYKILKDETLNLRAIFKQGILPKERIRAFRKGSEKIERALFRGLEDNANHDFFRFVSISDSTHLSRDKLRIETTKMLGTTRFTKVFIETINPLSELEFDLCLDYKELSFENLGLKGLKEYQDKDKILYACYVHSKDILDKESKYFSSKPEILSLINKLKKENQPNSPLLKIGAGQGFLSITINLIMQKKGDMELYDEVIREGVSSMRRWRTIKDNFPKTRRVVIDSRGNEISLMGWCKIL